MLHDTICRDLRLLKDGNGRYLWVDSVQQGKPDTILGYPVTTNNDMASTTASGTKSVLFGTLSKYMIRDVGTVRVKRLVERYADNDQEAFVAFMRFDGNLMDAGVAPVKVLTH
jgi:HK97 family phage major capsid protein